MSGFELFLLRHGIAHDFDPASMKTDADRRLTSEGREKISQQARGVAKLALGIEHVLSSPYSRARETAELTVAALTEPSLELSEALVPHAQVEAIMRELERRKFRTPTLLVGHEPHLGELASFLLAGNTDAMLEVKKGALLGFHFERLGAPFRAQLLFSLPPKVLRQLGD